MSKIPRIIFFAFIFLLSFISLALAQSVPYENQQFHFRLNFPDGWEVKENYNSERTTLNVYADGNGKKSFSFIISTIVPEKKRLKNYYSDENVANIKENLVNGFKKSSPNLKLEDAKLITVNNKKAYQLLLSDPANEQHPEIKLTIVFLYHNHYFYVITYGAESGTNNSDFNNALKSFQII